MTAPADPPPQTPPPTVILAGGQARRMGGGDKALVVLAGRLLLARVIDRLTPQCGAIALSANGDASRFARFDLPVLADATPDQPGPLAGVLAGMDWAAARGAGHVLTVAVDTPFLPPDLGARLQAASRGAGGRPAIAASRDASGRVRAHPTAGLWPVALRAALRAALACDRRRVMGWATAQGAVEVVFDTVPVDPFFNVNTPGDVTRAEACLRA